ncbi:MAG TPA: hypothetical protein VM432_09050 [Bdellovibrionales bacterium]|nr:hypothetical protein [Bdellovibrionales bacterium]
MVRKILVSLAAVALFAGCNDKNSGKESAKVPDSEVRPGELSESDLSGTPARVNGLWSGTAVIELDRSDRHDRTSRSNRRHEVQVNLFIEQSASELVVTAWLNREGTRRYLVDGAHFQIDQGNLYNENNRRVGDIGRGGFETNRNVELPIAFKVRQVLKNDRFRRDQTIGTLVMNYVNRQGREARLTAQLTRNDYRRGDDRTPDRRDRDKDRGRGRSRQTR